MSEEALRNYYLKQRLAPIPNQGRFLTMQQEDGSMIDVQSVILAEWDSMIRGVRAAAWYEGFDAGERDAFDVMERPHAHKCIPNPYRTEEEQA